MSFQKQYWFLKVIGGFEYEAEKTSIENIYALGDVLDGVPELTPVAQKSGQFLAKRLAIKKVIYLEFFNSQGSTWWA